MRDQIIRQVRRFGTCKMITIPKKSDFEIGNYVLVKKIYLPENQQEEIQES